MSEHERANTKAEKKAEAEINRHQPSDQWRTISKRTWQDIASKGYWPNFIVGVVLLLLAPLVGLMFNSYKAAIICVACALTLVIWVVAILALRQVSPPESPETELHGFLLPANDSSPPNPCGNVPPEAVSLFVGNVVAWTTHFPMTVLRVHERELLTIGKTDNGLSVSAKIFSADGRIIAELEDNEFHVNPNNYFKVKRPDRSTLSVYDQQDRAVLNVRYLNPSAVKFSGIFYYPSNPNPIVIDDEKVRLPTFQNANALCAGNNRIALFIGSPIELLKDAEKSNRPASSR